ncbi:MAG TPA: AAA family ATPase [Methanocorpusculum sp.]|nr:AAA family ATPase [Methanocorpusculum sp.]
MITRSIDKRLIRFRDNHEKKALLITGARQTGKTYSIRELGKSYASCIEINFLENPAARQIFAGFSNADDLLLRISAVADKPLIPGKTLIFFDEVQECQEIVTAVKFLVDEGSYQYILSGSLLGVELNDIRSYPLGYMEIVQMYSLDFGEFIRANGVSDAVIKKLGESYSAKTPVDSIIHEKMMDLFRLYLIIGGMPAVVDTYLKTNDIRRVIEEQNAIISLFKKDISRYNHEYKLHIEEVFTTIPMELNRKNKRFIISDVGKGVHFQRLENSFLWVKDAGVALPAYSVEEPMCPLKLSGSVNLFKLFLCDTGLLSAMYIDGIQLRVLNRETDINFGSVYENAAAQEFTAHGFELYYFNSKKQGELDFVLEQGGRVLPIEIKSGKNYARHRALSNVLENPLYGISEGFVFCNDNVRVKEKITYLPMYMMMFLKKDVLPEKMVYRVDMKGLA